MLDKTRFISKSIEDCCGPCQVQDEPDTNPEAQMNSEDYLLWLQDWNYERDIEKFYS